MRSAQPHAGCHHVIRQPILRLHRAIVFGGVSWECESLGELLLPDAGPEARRSGKSLLFFQILLQLLDAMSGVVLRNQARAEALTDCGFGCSWALLPPAANRRLVHPAVRNQRILVVASSASVRR